MLGIIHNFDFFFYGTPRVASKSALFRLVGASFYHIKVVPIAGIPEQVCDKLYKILKNLTFVE